MSLLFKGPLPSHMVNRAQNLRTLSRKMLALGHDEHAKELQSTADTIDLFVENHTNALDAYAIQVMKISTHASMWLAITSVIAGLSFGVTVIMWLK